MTHPSLAAALLLALLLSISCRSTPEHAQLPAVPSTRPVSAKADEPPPAAREFRAAWVATVANIDWPSKAGLSTEQQQREAVQILDRAAEINLNAIILQVRTTADALYDSKLEPWSAFITGKQGQAPTPYYDPLRFWIDEAHKRGIELHAWFNPYRTDYGGQPIEAAANHISRARPDLNRKYGKMGWMDPGEPDAADHSFRVFMDVVERYDVDGIHIDDYFYPYPVPLNPDDKDDKREQPFPDDVSYQRYRDGGGRLSRDNWRRENINKLIRRIYEGIRARKKEVKFGISPFGIPRPGLEGIEYIKGFDQYDKLYADTVLWLKNGWCDYFVPQLYWKIGAPQQAYLGLLQWWTHNNPKNRHIYPGLFTSRIDWSDASWCTDEILGQIMIQRLTPGAHGHVHFSMIALTQNRRQIAAQLRDVLYKEPALVPRSSWLDKSAPTAPRRVEIQRREAAASKPAITVEPEVAATRPATTRPYRALPPPTTAPTPSLASTRVTWQSSGGEPPFVYAVYYKIGQTWKLKTVPAHSTEAEIVDDATAGPPTHVAVSAVDRCGNESDRTTIPTGLRGK